MNQQDEMPQLRDQIRRKSILLHNFIQSRFLIVDMRFAPMTRCNMTYLFCLSSREKKQLELFMLALG